MIKLTNIQKRYAMGLLDFGGGYDLDDPTEKAEYDKIKNADWFIFSPSENNQETTDEDFCFSLQYYDIEYKDFREVDCITPHCYKEIISQTPRYIYDINYRLKTTSVFSVIAHNATEARKIAQQELENMPKADLIDRFLDALNFAPEFTITAISEIEPYEEDDDGTF